MRYLLCATLLFIVLMSSCTNSTLKIEHTYSVRFGCGIMFTNTSKTAFTHYVVSVENIKSEKVKFFEFTLAPTESQVLRYGWYEELESESGSKDESKCEEIFSRYKVECKKEIVKKKY